MYSVDARIVWVGLGCVVLCCVVLCCVVLCCVVLCCVVLCCVVLCRLCCVVLCCVVLCCAVLGWVGLGWIGLDWIVLGWAKLNFIVDHQLSAKYMSTSIKTLRPAHTATSSKVRQTGAYSIGLTISGKLSCPSSGLYYKHCYAPRVLIYYRKVYFNLECTLRV
jgi:hypothetical protein